MKQSTASSYFASWWPPELGTPASSGSDENLRYAYFPLKYRLAIKRGGALTIYDTGDYHFRGALQANPHDSALTFYSQRGRVNLDVLAVVTG